MADIFTKEKRSDVMRKVKSHNTKPELKIGDLLVSLGYDNYRTNDKSLPGTPDFLLNNNKVIFVNGCFWHSHKNCKYSGIPKTNKAFWLRKFRRNSFNERSAKIKLTKMNYSYLTIWTCQLNNIEKLRNKLKIFLRG